MMKQELETGMLEQKGEGKRWEQQTNVGKLYRNLDFFTSLTCDTFSLKEKALIYNNYLALQRDKQCLILKRIIL